MNTTTKQTHQIVMGTAQTFITSVLAIRTSTDIDNMISAFDTDNHVDCYHALQVGATTTMLAYVLWKMLTVPNYNVSIVVSYRTRLSTFSALIDLCANIPEWVKAPLSKVTNNSMTFENGSSVRGIHYSGEHIKGTSPDLIVLDNVAIPINETEDTTMGLCGLQNTQILLLRSEGMLHAYKPRILDFVTVQVKS